MKSAAKQTPPKPYQSPTLIVYGDLTQLTKTSPKNTGSMEMATGSPKT